MNKDAWIQAHEELIAEFLEENPGVSESAAYDITAERVNDRLADHHAAQIDQWRLQQKEG